MNEEDWPENHPVLQLARRRAREAEAFLDDRYPEAGRALLRLRDLLQAPTGDDFDVLGIQVGRIDDQPLVTMGFLGEDAVKALTILARHWGDDQAR